MFKPPYFTQEEFDAYNKGNRSTGPKTEEGKKKSSRNAMRHGLTGANFIMDDEDRAAWEAFSKPLIASMKPANPMEQQLAYLVAQDNYRLNRIHAIEENTFTGANYDGPYAQPLVFAQQGRDFQNLSLYEQRITRNMHKNLKALQQLQDRRKAEEREASLETAKPKTRAAGASPEGQEFVFSNAQTTPQITVLPPTKPDSLPPSAGQKAA